MLLKPDIKLNRVTDINAELLKKYGIKALILDVDNTLSTHHGEVLTDGLESWLSAMRENGIEPKKLRFVSKRGDTQPWLVLIDGRRGGKNGLKVEKPLIVENTDGTLSDEMLGITEKYRENLK